MGWICRIADRGADLFFRDVSIGEADRGNRQVTIVVVDVLNLDLNDAFGHVWRRRRVAKFDQSQRRLVLGQGGIAGECDACGCRRTDRDPRRPAGVAR